METEKKFYFDIKWFVILAIVAFLVIFQVLPLLYLVYRSFFYSGSFSLDGFKRIYSYPLNWTCLKNTLVTAGLAMVFGVLLAFPLAWLVGRTNLYGKKFFRTLFVMTYMVPPYVDVYKRQVGDEALITNEAALFIGADGARVTNNANEVAHYEYGAALASDCLLDAMDKLAPGVSELELGDCLVRYGQHTSIVTIAASGPRFIKANMFPTANTVKVGDTISLTVGYCGGSSSRSGYAVHGPEELPQEAGDYADRVAAPYFAAYACWLEQIHVGMAGGALFDQIEEVPVSYTHLLVRQGL